MQSAESKVNYSFILAQSKPYLLSPRETQIVYLLMQGQSCTQIAICLDISSNTVRTLVKRVYLKMNVSSKTAMIIKILESNE
ncbi:helix-turn-helix transcriptional regulator [Cohnella faecalis]|uniref:LuxR family transcriptional regulator n=1 Tax=Cohnella faecalis TaxID=2315694 RepID=A0A398CRQ1_9BACL|nr:helix-turn-helix transcriptional regulator [Cohnella faecalis]RIE05233.1 LuxR family transcriptional regulator [Cohnella faecalis]